MRIKEERKLRRELVNIQPPIQTPAHILEPIRQGERQLLYCRGACLANVIPAHADGMPLRHIFTAELYGVHNQLHVGFGRENPLFLCNKLFENIVLYRARKFLQRHALLLGNRQIHRPDNDGGRINRHRGGDAAKVNPLKEDFHIFQGGDTDATLADLAFCFGVVGVHAHQGGQVKRHRQPCLPLLNQEPIAGVGLLGGGEARKLPNRPELGAIARFIETAREGILSGVA
ncbi:hypothetical protein HRbin14_02186 [bacterium HR14]|nr:hypothetical protein HRbin14_02186 [bacterium HR14]